MNKVKENGFTLIELLIYVAIFVVSAMFLVGVLIAITRVQNKQTSSNEVLQQTTFVGNFIQRLVRESSVIDMPTGESTTSIRLRMSESGVDPTLVFSSGTIIYASQGTSSAVAITNSSIVVNEFSVTKLQNSANQAVLDVYFVLNYDTENPQFAASKSYRSAITRISAATFDSHLLPGAATYNIGQQGATTWQRILVGDGAQTTPSYAFGNSNNLGIYRPGTDTLGFVTAGSERIRIDGSGNVGIGTQLPGVRLEVSGGEVKFSSINDGTGKLVCIKSDGNLGTCSNQPSGGTCTCQ